MAGDKAKLPNGAGEPAHSGSPGDHSTPPATPTHSCPCASHQIGSEAPASALRLMGNQAAHAASSAASTPHASGLLAGGGGAGPAAVPRFQPTPRGQVQTTTPGTTLHPMAPPSAFSNAAGQASTANPAMHQNGTGTQGLPVQGFGPQAELQAPTLAPFPSLATQLATRGSGPFGSYLTVNGSVHGGSAGQVGLQNTPWRSGLVVRPSPELAPEAAKEAAEQGAVCVARGPRSSMTSEGMGEGGGGGRLGTGAMDMAGSPGTPLCALGTNVNKPSQAAQHHHNHQEHDHEPPDDNGGDDGLERKESGDVSAIMANGSPGQGASHDRCNNGNGTSISGIDSISRRASPFAQQEHNSGERHSSPPPIDTTAQQAMPLTPAESAPRQRTHLMLSTEPLPTQQAGFGSPLAAAAPSSLAQPSPLRPTPHMAMAGAQTTGTQQQREHLLRMLHQNTAAYPTTPPQQQLPPISPLQQQMPAYPGMMYPAMYHPQFAPLLQHMLMMQGQAGHLAMPSMQLPGMPRPAGSSQAPPQPAALPTASALQLHQQQLQQQQLQQALSSYPLPSALTQAPMPALSPSFPTAAAPSDAAGGPTTPREGRPSTSRETTPLPLAPPAAVGAPGTALPPTPPFPAWPIGPSASPPAVQPAAGRPPPSALPGHGSVSPTAAYPVAPYSGAGMMTWGMPMSPHAMAGMATPGMGMPGASDGLGMLPWGVPVGSQAPGALAPAGPTSSHEGVGESPGGSASWGQAWPGMAQPQAAPAAGPQAWPHLRVRPRPVEVGFPATSFDGTLETDAQPPPVSPVEATLGAVPGARRPARTSPAKRTTPPSQRGTPTHAAAAPAHTPPTMSEPSEQEEDAAATLAGMMASSEGPASPYAPRQTSPPGQPLRKRTSSTGGPGASARRRSPPGGSAMWAQHPEVMINTTPTTTPTGTFTTTVSGWPGSQGMEEPTTPAGPHAATQGMQPPQPSRSARAGPASPGGEARTPRSAGPAGAPAMAAALPLPPAGGLASMPPSEIDWLEVLTTTDRFFKLCESCGGGLKSGERPSNGGRDALCTLLDLDAPREPGVCANCRTAREAMGHRLLQVRRSTYHDVVKAQDMAALRVDLSGLQAYSINNARVVFLQPRPSSKPPKGSTMPSRCVLDGRQLMDTGSRYCSLRCKMDVELHGVSPSLTARPEAERPTPRPRGPAVHRPHPSGSPGGPARKRQRTPPTSTTTSLEPLPASPGVSGARGGPGSLSPAEGVLAAATAHIGVAEHIKVHKRGEHKEEHAVPHHMADAETRQHAHAAEGKHEHVLYAGDHGLLDVIPEAPVEGADPDVQKEVAAETARLAADSEAVLHVTELEKPNGMETEAPQPGNPPFNHTARAGTPVPALKQQHQQQQHSPHHVTFGPGTSPGSPALSHPGAASSPALSGRTISAAASGHAHGAGVGDGSDSRSSGSVRRKASKVQRAPAE